jgi:hypothetical protein
VDFYAKVKNAEGEIKKYIIEVKPASQCKPPKKRKKITIKYKSDLKTYIRNQSKWKAARKWAEKRGMEFVILTEKELDIPSKSYKYKRNGTRTTTK